MSRLATMAFWTASISGGIRLGVPLMIASMGETMSQRAGVLNIGLEGYMSFGAFTSVYVAVEAGPVAGLVAGTLGGLLLSVIMVFESVKLNANQIVTGFAITILGLGLGAYFFDLTTPESGGRRQVGRIGETHIPGLSDIPFFGDAVFSNSWIVWSGIVLAVGVWWIADRTELGLAVRAVGEDPDAAFARGLNVVRIRSAAVMASGVTGGLAGAAISVGLVGVFEPGISAGRGFIVLIVIIMASWRIWGTVLGSFLFGFSEALGTNLRNVVSDNVPTEALKALPFLVAFTILVLGARRARMPTSLGVNYVPET